MSPGKVSQTDSTFLSPREPSFSDALRFWLKLGFISFGGPAGQIAIMHAELVERRRWISQRRFLHALNYCMVLPGPEAQQLATYIGWLLHGTRGGIAAGGLFVLPSLVLLLPLSWLYMAAGNVAWVQGVFAGFKPAVVAVVAFAMWRIGGRTIKNWPALIIAAAAFAALVMGVHYAIIVFGAGVLGLVLFRFQSRSVPSPVRDESLGSGEQQTERHRGEDTPALKENFDHLSPIIDDHHAPPPHARVSYPRAAVQLLIGLLLWALPLGALAAWQGWHNTPAQMGWFFTQAALLTFGGAYAVLPFVTDHALAANWLRPGQMIDGLALGETTPGPLIMVVSFVGFVGGWQTPPGGEAAAVVGCLVATYFTFLPSFLFILIGGPFVEAQRGGVKLTAVLSGITAAVVGVILHLAVFFAVRVFVPQSQAESFAWNTFSIGDIDWFAVLLAAAAFVALWKFKQPIVRVVLGCGAVGLVQGILW